MTLPLSGITVVALEQAVAGPIATRGLADLGARVIKIERPDGGDLARHYDNLVLGTAAHFVWLNRGKESVCLDLKTPAGLDAARAIIARADVVVQNLAPGATARLGLDATSLRSARPELIVADLSGYGEGGPSSDRRAYDLIIQADSGLASVTGSADHAAKTGVAAADIGTGMYVTQAVLAALLRRERTGEGASISVTMLEAMAEWLGYSLYAQLFTGRQSPRMGLGHPGIVPYDVFATKDGEILIGVQNDRQWRTLAAQVLGDAALADDPRFHTNIDRVAQRAVCDAAVEERTRRWTTAELDERLAAAGIPGSRMNSLAGLVEHPQLKARDRWRTVQTEHGPAPALLPPVTFADVEAPMGRVPALGADTARILEEFAPIPPAARALAPAPAAGAIEGDHA